MGSQTLQREKFPVMKQSTFSEPSVTGSPSPSAPTHRARVSSMILATAGRKSSDIKDAKDDTFSPQNMIDPHTDDQTIHLYSVPQDWWAVRSALAARPWRERGISKRQRTIPPEQEERWSHTKDRVAKAAHSVFGYTLDVGHEALLIGVDVLEFAPIAGLQTCARVLLTIWDAVQLVETNRLACLRLTERCADILLCVREEVHEAGDEVGQELQDPLQKLTYSFNQVLNLLRKQVSRPFLKRYLKRDEILRSIAACDASLSDALGLFSLSIQIRTLKQLQTAEARRQADTERLLHALINDLTPKQQLSQLPNVGELPSTSTSTPPPMYAALPEPAVRKAPGPSISTIDVQRAVSPQHLTPSDVRKHIEQIMSRQAENDQMLDLQDQRQLMRNALATCSDSDMIQVLQVQRDELPEAIKTLQRALEHVVALDQEQQERAVVLSSDDVADHVTSPTNELEGLQLSGVPDVSSRDSRASSLPSNISYTVERDTLDREFIESGIDALRRCSGDRELSLPSWTITRYEVDLEEKIGIGYFSDVYRGIWRHHTVAVKVLAPSTPRKLFLHEISVWRSLDHPNVLPLLGASSTVGDPPWFLVSPYMKNGNMISYLKSLKTGSSWDPTKLVYEIARGMEYLHKKGVLHGDLKGANVLIDDNLHCVLGDFGQSEMKSEAFRISGQSPPHGTLRWLPPELMDGSAVGTLKAEVDVYAFAIVCVEVLTKGALPWSLIDDDSVRHLVLKENRRPPMPLTAVSIELSDLIEACWARDPKVRPPFNSIVKAIRKLRGKVRDSPIPQKVKDLWADDIHPRKSPDLQPPLLPNPPNTDSHPRRNEESGSGTSQSYQTARSGELPIERIITPNRDSVVVVQNSLSDSKTVKDMNYETYTYSDVESQKTSPSTNSTGRSSFSDVGIEIGHPLSRWISPPPTDESIAQRKNESRYRLNLRHDFHPSLTLPLWDPSPVALGAVGYLLKPEGSFVTLFNAFDPPKTSDNRANGMPSLYGYGRLTQASQRQDRRTARGIAAMIQGLLTFKTRHDAEFSQAVSRRYSFPLRAGQKSAYICTETTSYRYMESLTTPKAWFIANISHILELYGEEHHLQKEDVFLVIGTLDAPDYALFVNHNNPDGQVHFNVFSSQKTGAAWGVFSTDTELPPIMAGGPSYHEDAGVHSSANKISIVRSSRTWDTVLLARLRFKTDVEEPTSLP